MLKFCKGCKNGEFDLIINMICKLAGTDASCSIRNTISLSSAWPLMRLPGSLRLPFFVETLQPRHIVSLALRCAAGACFTGFMCSI